MVATIWLFTIINTYPVNDEIFHLPGWKGALPSRMFAGYIEAGNDTVNNVTYELYEHYMFIESENDPKTDPVMIWTNGGPGASSFFGLFVELGPFYLSSDSLKTDEYEATDIPTLFRNNHTWSSNASILIINSPSPIGYSYCKPFGPTGDGKSCGDWDDNRTATQTKTYLDNWMENFPTYNNNTYFIVGESYGGVYVPTLVQKLRADNSSKLYK